VVVRIKFIRLAAAAIALLAVSVLFLHLSTTDHEFSRYNIGWNGTSVFAGNLEDAGGVVLHETADLPTYRDAVLLLIAPEGEIPDSEIGDYRAFLKRNNTLFISDESGASNKLLREIGSDIRVIPGKIAGFDSGYADPLLPNGYPESDHPLLKGVASIAFNHPAQVMGGEALVSSGIFSWYDLDGNGRMEVGEPSGRFVFISSQPVGGGEVIVCADPSILINTMLGRGVPGDGAIFADNLLSYRNTAILESAHSATAATGGIGQALAHLKASPPLQAGIMGACLLVAGIAWRRRVCPGGQS